MRANRSSEMEIKAYTMELAKFVADLRYEHLPQEVVSTIKESILDTLGCGIYGSTLPWGQIITEFVKKAGDCGKATVWGRNILTSAANAALANGTMVHGFELDDVHKGGRVHPGAVCVTAAFALSEENGPVDGKGFITALVAGYEVVTRVAKAVAGSHSIRGFHPQGTTGTFGSAAAAAKILGMSKNEIANAFGLAGAQSAGLHAAQFGPMAKRFHAGRAAQSGVYAVQLAKAGFTGAIDILEKPYGGFCKAFADEFDLDLLVKGLSKDYESGKTGLKHHCGCGANQAVLDLISDFMASKQLRVEEIEKITIKTERGAWLHVGWKYSPAEVTTAQMNLSYNVAVLLLEGQCFVEQFREELLSDPRVMEIIEEKIEVVYDPALDVNKGEDRLMIVNIVYRQGQHWTGNADMSKAKGTPSNRLTKEEIITKFKKLTVDRLDEDHSAALISKVADLESLTDIVSLAGLLVR